MEELAGIEEDVTLCWLDWLDLSFWKYVFQESLKITTFASISNMINQLSGIAIVMGHREEETKERKKMTERKMT